ncbi:metallopeptidase TldD-related protein [Streptomyces sedi]|uniref:TldD/PmbA family protein n=1 Tax=Streptomyces sedi TaxID=555059 RepID=A0A5C4V168_9ACTN|nr:metallopeptidase TldD-related protein [Streptomyces sedi]TNM29383.1 TldD/PmbA family protein [Streptomyces sedi]
MSAAGPHETIERALELSRADGTVVIVEERSSANLRWALNALTTNGQTRGRQLTVIATVNGATGVSVGVVSRSAATGDEVEAVVRAAEEAARQSPTSDEASPLVPGTAMPASADFADAPAETSSAVFGGFAPALGETFARAAREGRELFGFAEHEMVSSYLGTSSGLRLRHDQATGSLELNAKSDGRRRSSFVTVPVHDFSALDLAALDSSLAARLAWGDRTVDLPPGRYETLLPPSSVADLLLYQHLTVDARRTHEGRTVFSRPGGGTRAGERLTGLPMTLTSDPADAGMEAAPFVLTRSSADSFLASNSVFDNGLPLGRTEWIADGTLRTLTSSRHSAELSGLPLAPVVDNLRLDAGGTASLDELVATTERGLLVTSLWYIREVDPKNLLLTGLTRDGVFLVEGGQVVGQVNNFRFNESPVEVIARASEASATGLTRSREWGRYFPRVAMPALRVPEFHMSSVSPGV